MAEQNVLLIFVKNPEKGKVKTRLAKTIGDEKALEVYKKLIAYTRQITSEVSASRKVWYSRFVPENDEWDTEKFEKKIQQGDDLGMRMKNAFAESFTSNHVKVVIIGSDSAQITTEGIENAFSELEENELVIGPSEDGGYYLLGMQDFYPEFFEGIDWSTSKVFAQTLKIARRKGLKTSILPELNDVDNEEDWQSVKDQL
ncbi:MAG: TIGR04282 family arsenosugar biosynthesis glycosyltransferase [Balneolaceae bacterium]|nr:TIGR04282 family arsenosugar biosynthesis glycosyltransferase [Balneolaceae bacterium]